MAEPRGMYLEITIDGPEMDVEVVNGDGQKCHAMADPFFALGQVLDKHEKPEAQTVGQSQRRATKA